MNHPNTIETPSTAATAVEQTLTQTEVEIACVDLLCKLEFALSELQEVDKSERLENAHLSARKMLAPMVEFSDAFFTGKMLEKTKEGIENAITGSHVYETLLENRSWGSLLSRTFGGKDPAEKEIMEAHCQLRRLLKRAIVTLLYHAIKLVGFESSLGKQLDQSTVIFVSDLQSF